MVPKKADTVIIGGGVVGASLAYFLAKNKRDVVLVDKGMLAGESSAANGAWAWTLTRRAGIDIRLSMHSVGLLQSFREELERDQEYRQPGGLLVFTDEKQLPFVQAHVKARAEDGHPLQMLDAKQARELEPLLSEKILGAVFSDSTGLLNPLFLVIALVEQARKLGAQIFYHTKVQSIDVRGGKVRGVLTDKGLIATERVVNAAGPWAGQIGKMVGLNVPISPYQMQKMITEQMPPLLSHCIMSASYVLKEYEKEDMSKEKQTFGCALCASQQKPGNLILGATWEEVGFDKRVFWKHIHALATEHETLIPALRHVSVIRAMANFFPFTKDDLPILGYVNGIEGFIMCSGHNGHGILLGPGSAKLIQELICEGKTSIPIDELSLSRFH